MRISLIEKALQLAIYAHAGQADKVGKPYILHPISVGMMGQDEDEMIVGFLHDTVEDSPERVSFEDLEEEGFLPHQVEAVKAITKVGKEPYDDYLARVKANDLATRVKFNDIRHNTCPDRLDQLPQASQVYLKTKYAHAISFLQEEGEQTLVDSGTA